MAPNLLQRHLYIIAEDISKIFKKDFGIIVRERSELILLMLKL